MCVKINVLYMCNVQCTYCIYSAPRIYIYMRVVQYAFLFTFAGPTHFARISKITTRQIRNVNVCKCC